MHQSRSKVQELEKRVRLERVLTRIASKLAKATHGDEVIDDILADMGRLVGVDRAYVFRIYEGGALMDNTHEWCAPGVSCEIENLQNLPSDSLPWFMQQLKQGRTFQIPDVSALPPEAEAERAILESQNIRSCLILPMQDGERLNGFVGFDNIHDVQAWQGEDAELLLLAAQLLSDFFMRDQTHRDLEVSLQRQLGILENIPDIAWLKDAQSRFVFVNQPFAASTGMDSEKLVQKTDFDIWPRNLAERYREDDREVMRTRRPMRVEEPVVDKQGKERIVETIKTPIIDSKGEVLGTTGIARDITERKIAETALRESEERYRRLVESMPGIVYRYSRGKGASYWSPQVEKILGYTQHDLEEKPFLWHESIHPQDLPKVDNAIANFEVGKSIDLVYRIKNREGRWLWFHDRSVGRQELSHEVVIEGIASDITARKIAEQALYESEQKYRLLVENQSDLVVKVDMEGRFEFTSPSYCAMFGKEEQELIGNTFMPLVHEEDRQATAAAMESLASPPYECYVEQRAKTIYGWRWLAWVDRAVLDGNGRPVGVVGVGRDITKQHALEHALHAEREKALVTLQSIGDAVITTNERGIVEFLNPVAESLTGWSLKEAEGRPLAEIFSIINEESRQPALDPVARCLSEGKTVDLANHTVLISRSGKEFAIEDTAAPIITNEGKVLGVVLVFKDVSEARRLSQQVSYQAAHDALTGLINRAEFEQRLTRVLESAKAQTTRHAFCYLDLDQFKLVNDTCGHVAGDELLRQLGGLLKEHLRKRDTLARLGGDEFGLLIEHCSLADAQGIAENLIKVLSQFSFPWEDHSFNVGASIGLVSVDWMSHSMGDILRAADSACYMAKEKGRNRVHVHQEDDEQLAQRHGEMQWAVRIPRALDEDRFQLYFQEILPIQGKSAPSSRHYELLLRMLDETGRLIAPAAFLPAAERYNLSEKIDQWVISKSFAWLQEHPSHLEKLNHCSINLSGLSLSDKNFLPFVIEKFSTSGIPPEKICFEITETMAIANLSSAIALIDRLRTLGCQFALDDFGSGLSSFAYLKNLPVDFLKIDGLFVKDILDDPMDFAMVKSINEIGHVMGKLTIAEFVEDKSVLEKLREIGVDYVQGYYFGMPRPIDELIGRA